MVKNDGKFNTKKIKNFLKASLKKVLKSRLNTIISKFIPVTSKLIGRPRKIDNSLQYAVKKQTVYFNYETLSCLESDLQKKNNLTNGGSTLLFICEFNKSRVWGRYGAVVTSDDTFLKDVSLEFPSLPPLKHSIFYTLWQKRCDYIQGKSAVISAPGANIYYHWMIDILPRIELLKRQYKIHDFNHFICDYTALPFQRETLEFLQISKEKILKSNDNWNFHIEGEKLVVPSVCGILDRPNVFQVDSLRNIFAKFISHETPTRQIYISRKNSALRKLKNEIEITNFLEKIGFEIVRCEEMKIFEQVKIFSQAKTIVGPHGSGFTNIVFCQKGSKVIEFFNEAYINPCFSIIADIRETNYSYIITKSEQTNSNDKNCNINLTIDELIIELNRTND